VIGPLRGACGQRPSVNALRIFGSTSAFGPRLASLVHDSAQADAAERDRHARFIAVRLAAGALGLAGLAPYLVWRGAPSGFEAGAVACLMGPVAAAMVLSRTGSLALAHGVSAAALGGLAVCLAAVSGGVGPAAVWLVVLLIEAVLSGSRPATLAVGAVAGLGVLALAALSLVGPNPAGLATAVVAALAVAAAVAQALAGFRREAARRAGVQREDAPDRLLLHAIDDLVTWHDRRGHVLKANAAATKLLGAPACALQGQGLFARVHVPDRPGFLKALDDAAASGAPTAVQFRLRAGPDEDGRPKARGARAPEPRLVWVEMRAHRIDETETECAVVAVTRDISEHRRRAEELEAARSAAEGADRSKGRFLATVSHELRTPLNAIIGFSEILASDALAPADGARRKEYAQIIHDSGQHLLGVVNTLLDMSKIESGAFELAPEPFDLGELAAACCDLMRLKAGQAGLSLACEAGRGLPEIVADRRACRQVLINLLSNAVKFTPRGGAVTVSVRREGDRVLIVVADTGMGIAADDLSKVGAPFFQAGPHYSRAHEGTGLGLSVVRGLVGLHGGTLAIESAPGEGTSVTVSLPFDCRAGRPPAGELIPIRALARARPNPPTDQRIKHRA
jgi:two-component system, cell cycle sensor histidine kinase DivJ